MMKNANVDKDFVLGSICMHLPAGLSILASLLLSGQVPSGGLPFREQFLPGVPAPLQIQRFFSSVTKYPKGDRRIPATLGPQPPWAVASPL